MADPKPESNTQIAVLDPRKLGLPARPVTDLDQVEDALVHARQHGCNVLAPPTRIDFIPPLYQVGIRVVEFTLEGMVTQPDREGRIRLLEERYLTNGVWYKLDGGKLGLSRAALDMVASAAGGSYLPSQRLDDGKAEHYWRYNSTIVVKGFDGTIRKITREKELDLRDGSPETVGMTANQLKNARKFGAALCESKAANRATRAAFGIRSYTLAEALRPFVFPVLIFAPDTSDPEIKRMIVAKELGIAREVYGRDADESNAPIFAEPGTVVDVPVRTAAPPVPKAADGPGQSQRSLPGPGLEDGTQPRTREPVPARTEDPSADPWETGGRPWEDR